MLFVRVKNWNYISVKRLFNFYQSDVLATLKVYQLMLVAMLKQIIL